MLWKWYTSYFPIDFYILLLINIFFITSLWLFSFFLRFRRLPNFYINRSLACQTQIEMGY
jgi:hypothetical protein